MTNEPGPLFWQLFSKRALHVFQCISGD